MDHPKEINNNYFRYRYYSCSSFEKPFRGQWKSTLTPSDWWAHSDSHQFFASPPAPILIEEKLNLRIVEMFDEMKCWVASGITDIPYSGIASHQPNFAMPSFTHNKNENEGFVASTCSRILFIRAQISRNEMSKCIDAISSVSPFWYRITHAIRKRIKRTRSPRFFLLFPKMWVRVESRRQYSNWRCCADWMSMWIPDNCCVLVCLLLLLIMYAVGDVWHSDRLWQTLEIPKPISSIFHIYIFIILVQMPQQNTNNAQIEFERGIKWLVCRKIFWVGID